MALLDIRQRAGYLFLVVILGHILLISVQVNSGRGVPMLEAVTFGAFLLPALASRRMERSDYKRQPRVLPDPGTHRVNRIRAAGRRHGSYPHVL